MWDNFWNFMFWLVLAMLVAAIDFAIYDRLSLAYRVIMFIHGACCTNYNFFGA